MASARVNGRLVADSPRAGIGAPNATSKVAARRSAGLIVIAPMEGGFTAAETLLAEDSSDHGRITRLVALTSLNSRS